MRLLQFNNPGNFSPTEFIEDNIPRYGILSHTWGADGDEVTFKDLMEGTGGSKAGYDKLLFCGEQAKKNDLRYFWVDTCCIDKSSTVELSEAINSMFRWYRNADKCYVLLTDVSKHGNDENNRDSQLRISRWFTRGWTLQELIASRSADFFSREGELLGDKKSLEQQLQEITGIPIQALQGNPLSQFSVAERMSWAARRETKRKEDKAYSLLGIFDIHMPLIYREGERNAFRRLQNEINSVPYRNLSSEGQEEHVLTSNIPTIRSGDIPIPHQPVRYAATPEQWYRIGRSKLLNTNTLEFTNGLHAMSPADRTAAAKVIIHNCQAASYQFYETNSLWRTKFSTEDLLTDTKVFDCRDGRPANHYLDFDLISWIAKIRQAWDRHDQPDSCGWNAVLHPFDFRDTMSRAEVIPSILTPWNEVELDGFQKVLGTGILYCDHIKASDSKTRLERLCTEITRNNTAGEINFVILQPSN